MEKYFTVKVGEGDEEQFYVSRKRFSFRFHEAACFSDDESGRALADQIAKRYNGTVSEDHGYNVKYVLNLKDVEERSVESLLKEVTRYARREGWSLELLLMKTEQSYATSETKPVVQQVIQ